MSQASEWARVAAAAAEEHRPKFMAVIGGETVEAAYVGDESGLWIKEQGLSALDALRLARWIMAVFCD